MREVFYYEDELNDDFSDVVKELRPLPADYRYVNRNIFFRLFAFLIYRVVARPLVWLYMKVRHHQKFIGKKALKGIGGGYFIYANHVMLAGDAFTPNLLSCKRRNYIVTGDPTSSLTAILPLLKALGNIPIGQTPAQKLQMLRCVREKIAQGASVTIYPEAHIWPYYTGIRPFGEESFRYAALCGAPVVSLTTCFQKRRFGKTPRVRTYVDGPFYPQEGLSRAENMKYLRDAAYAAMSARAAAYSTYSYHEYRRKENEHDTGAG